jgi:hypothetical protein
MQNSYGHLSDEELLLILEGELPSKKAKAVQEHLESCWQCRSRQHEFENTITEYIHFRQRELDVRLPPADGPRALLRANLRQWAESKTTISFGWWSVFRRHAMPILAAASGLLILGVVLANLLLRSPAPAAVMFTPNPRLTPGATVLADRQTICSEESPSNKGVSLSLQRKVFDEYGLHNAKPKDYEVDYLITPALGGADDIRNLWPQPYAAAWNAKVKDELEDRLRHLVCTGTLDLTQAQREIATNWVQAYKKYLHRSEPSSGTPQPD